MTRIGKAMIVSVALAMVGTASAQEGTEFFEGKLQQRGSEFVLVTNSNKEFTLPSAPGGFSENLSGFRDMRMTIRGQGSTVAGGDGTATNYIQMDGYAPA